VTTIQLAGAVKGAPPITEKGPEGVPVIPTKRSGLGEILSNAPLLLERLATLTERLTMVLSDKNQKSIENILTNTDRMTSSLADTAPDVKRTMAELQSTLRQANYTLASFEKLAGSADTMINDEGNGLAKQLKATLQSAQNAANSLQATMDDARPAARQLNERTLPAAEAAIRDLQATTRSLREVTDKINDRGVGSLVGGPRLPDYKP
jgi:phospholipid/cholesterol/gamma-HCH transport system substrate-binding protein